MLGTSAVKIMAMEANISPARNVIGGTRSTVGAVNRISGNSSHPMTMITTSTMVELIRLLVAPHMISPVMTSSKLTGVATMASNVF